MGEGIVGFFGRPAYTMTLAARLTEGGATVLLAYKNAWPMAGYHQTSPHGAADRHVLSSE